MARQTHETRLAEIKETAKLFRIALLRAEINQRDFCDMHEIDHNIFNQAINGWRNLNPSYRDAVDRFIRKDRDAQKKEWMEKLKIPC